MLALPPPSQVAPGNTGFSSQVAPGSQLPDCCRSWLELQILKPNSVLKSFLYPVRDPVRGTTDFPGFRSWSGVETSSQRGVCVRSPMRRALISKDLDRRAASKRAQKRGGDVRSPMRGAPFSKGLDRGDGFEKDTSRTYFSHA